MRATPAPVWVPTGQGTPMVVRTAEAAETPTSGQTADVKPFTEWRGNGMKKTEPFTVNTAPWVVAWRLRGTDLGGLLSIWVKRADTGELVSLVANTTENGGDSSYIHETGQFYLDINAMGTWAIQVFAEGK